MTDAQTIAANYIAAWNERDATKRKQLLSAHWTANANYTDPLASVDGVDQIDALIAGVQQRFPDFQFALIGKLDGFGNEARFNVRFSWGLGPAGVDAPIKGSDFAEVSGSKINRVTGFLDQVPPHA